jgi:hypothetical protein
MSRYFLALFRPFFQFCNTMKLARKSIDKPIKPAGKKPALTDATLVPGSTF